jgi:hypothetical protein
VDKGGTGNFRINCGSLEFETLGFDTMLGMSNYIHRGPKANTCTCVSNCRKPLIQWDIPERELYISNRHNPLLATQSPFASITRTVKHASIRHEQGVAVYEAMCRARITMEVAVPVQTPTAWCRMH